MQNTPGNSEQVKELVATRIAAARGRQGIQASLEVLWRSVPESLPVISMPLDKLTYNPETHRIKAQRDFRASGDRAIKTAPWSDAAQDYLGELLAALPVDPSRIDPDFDKLREDLKTYGQKDPGIITPEGILINGNSRCAALRANGSTDMRVAVLPTDWTWVDIALLELDLQMRRDHRRDYSFINLMLALEESVNAAGTENAEKAFRLKRSTVERNLWILAVLRDLVERSQVEGSENSLNLRDFETDQGKLEELHRTYAKVYRSEPVAAERLKESRLLALLLTKSKTDLRLISDTFATDHLSKSLPADFVVNPALVVEVEIPGLGVSVTPPTELDDVTAQLVAKAAQARAKSKSANPNEREEAKSYIRELDGAVEKAINSAGREDRLKKRKTAAVEKMTAATDTLESTIADIVEAKSKNALDEEALNEALIILEEVLGRLGTTILRVADASGEGFQWLERNKANGAAHL